METPQRALTRQELYDLVWSRPATKLAAEFGVSDVAVAKACRKLNVPRPSRGHWAKLAHRKRSPQLALPPAKSGAPTAITLGDFDQKRRVAKRVAVRASGPAVVEPAGPLPLHAVTRDTKRALAGGWTHSTYGTLNPKVDVPHFALSVTPPQVTRALDLLNRLIWLFEKNGFELQPPKAAGGSYVLVFRETGTALDASLREPVERYGRELTAEDKQRSYVWDRWKYRPTGRFRFALNEYYPVGTQKTWVDGKHWRLEDLLPEIVEGCIVCARGLHAQHQVWAEERRRAEEESKRRQELERRQAEETARRGRLREAATDWRQVEAIRQFLAACEGRFGEGREPSEAERRWLAWARAVADQLDPLKSDYLPRAVQALGPEGHGVG
jgi:hypothetical protein